MRVPPGHLPAQSQQAAAFMRQSDIVQSFAWSACPRTSVTPGSITFERRCRQGILRSDLTTGPHPVHRESSVTEYLQPKQTETFGGGSPRGLTDFIHSSIRRPVFTEWPEEQALRVAATRFPPVVQSISVGGVCGEGLWGGSVRCVRCGIAGLRDCGMAGLRDCVGVY